MFDLVQLVASALAWRFKLPAALVRRVTVERGIRIAMPDGVELIADRYLPAIDGAQRLPVLLNRTPYGRKIEGLFARMFATRGYQVVVVSCRGTFGSGGVLDPLFNEAADGKAVLEWLTRQPWFPGRMGTFGASYHGFTQWSVLTDPPPFVAFASVMQSQSRFADIIWPRSTFALANVVLWLASLEVQELPLLKYFARTRAIKKKFPVAAVASPASACDTALMEYSIGTYQRWSSNTDKASAYWERINFGEDFSRVPPMLCVAGWYDLFCSGQLDDYVKLRKAGKPVRLVVGPWFHGQFGAIGAWARETVEWANRHFGHQAGPDHSVSLFDMGRRQWRDFPDWPPAAAQVQWFLQPEHRLASAPPTSAGVDRYRFDPANPTPIVGGNALSQDDAGPRDNRGVEARADVLTYTSAPMDKDLTVIGTLAADLFVRSSLDHTDFVVRLCDVRPDGRSMNLSDGIVRMTPQTIARAADGSFKVRVELTPTANTFLKGHRVRIQVASGAHPLHLRNPGTGETCTAAMQFAAADQEVLFGPQHPSSITLSQVD